MNSASARASSVLPTPVGPRNRNVPIGRSGSCRPARERRSAFATGLDRLVLADDALVQALLHVDRASRPRPPAGARPGCRSSCADDLGDVLGVDLLLEEAARSPSACRRRLGLGELLLELGDLAVAQLGGALQVGLALGALGLARAPARGARAARVTPSIASFSRCHCGLHRRPSARAARRARARSPRGARRRPRRSPSPATCSSISSCMMRRSTSSISVGIESISMRSREAASSIRSIALSGRKRSAM